MTSHKEIFIMNTGLQEVAIKYEHRLLIPFRYCFTVILLLCKLSKRSTVNTYNRVLLYNLPVSHSPKNSPY